MTEQETKEFELFELLRYVGGVKSTNWNTVLHLVGYIGVGKGKAVVESKKWYDKYKRDNPEYYPLDLSQVSTWSTFDGECIDLTFNAIDDKLSCIAKIYDGESFGGRRKELRFEATIILPLSFLTSLQGRIDYALSEYLEFAHENHLEAVKKLWIDNLKNEIMLDIKTKINK